MLTCTNVYIYMHALVHVYVYVYVYYMYMYMYLYVYVYVCIYIYLLHHTHICNPAPLHFLHVYTCRFSVWAPRWRLHVITYGCFSARAAL